MKPILVILLLVGACAHAQSAAPVNYAHRFVEAVMPSAQLAPLGEQSVWVIQDKVLAVCVADDKRNTTCHQVASWAPQQPPPAAAPQTPPAMPAPAPAPAPHEDPKPAA